MLVFIDSNLMQKQAIYTFVILPISRLSSTVRKQSSCGRETVVERLLPFRLRLVLLLLLLSLYVFFDGRTG